MAQSEALYIHMNPKVDDTNREAWESYIVGEDSYWIDSGLDFQKNDGTMNFTSGLEEIEEEHSTSNKTIDTNEHWPIWYYEANRDVDGSVIDHSKVVDLGPGPYFVTWYDTKNNTKLIAFLLKDIQALTDPFARSYL
jgi:hypothetical protein